MSWQRLLRPAFHFSTPKRLSLIVPAAILFSIHSSSDKHLYVEHPNRIANCKITPTQTGKLYCGSLETIQWVMNVEWKSFLDQFKPHLLSGVNAPYAQNIGYFQFSFPAIIGPTLSVAVFCSSEHSSICMRFTIYWTPYLSLCFLLVIIFWFRRLSNIHF